MYFRCLRDGLPFCGPGEQAPQVNFLHWLATIRGNPAAIPAGKAHIHESFFADLGEQGVNMGRARAFRARRRYGRATMLDLFQLTGPASARKIVVAMSGGVDSSVVAALAARTGAEVIGITLQLYDHGEAVNRAGSCCAGQDIRDARAVADKLGIAHYVFDHESQFKSSVIDHFADEYLRGRTPIPCVRCNMGVKFTDLFRLARDLGADCLATGHYVRRTVGATGAELHRALDPARDQSYFLFATTREQLDYLRFPLGGMPKQEVRAIARDMGLGVALKPDSQDICFVPDGDYAAVVRKVRPEAERDGAIVDLAGVELGRHKGLIHYTVGQRRGLELGGLVDPLYVIRLEPETQRVVVGPRAALAVQAARLSDHSWLDRVAGRSVQAKVRSLAKPVPARLDGDWLRFDAPEFGVSPGQAAVLYDGDRVLGGGWIEETVAP
jgi:tRNA-uridine 2-sulfurtransferase